MSEPLRCVILEDDSVSREILEKYVEQTNGLELDACFERPEMALNHLQNKGTDLLLLDVELPQMNGTQVLEHLERQPHVIFVTSDREYALDAFEHRAVDFLLKPFDYARFTKAIARVRELQESAGQDAGVSPDLNALFVRHQSKYVKVLLSEILFVEAIGDYMQIHTLKRRYTVHSTMKGMEQKLPGSAFQRVHRSYIIRLDAIEEIEDNTLLLPGNKFVPVGKSYRNRLLERLNLL